MWGALPQDGEEHRGHAVGDELGAWARVRVRLRLRLRLRVRVGDELGAWARVRVRVRVRVDAEAAEKQALPAILANDEI